MLRTSAKSDFACWGVFPNLSHANLKAFCTNRKNESDFFQTTPRSMFVGGGEKRVPLKLTPSQNLVPTVYLQVFIHMHCSVCSAHEDREGLSEINHF